MTIKMSSLEIAAKIPAMPASLPVHSVTAPSLEERRTAIRVLADQMQLGALRTVEIDHGLVMASERGDVTFFSASGGLWVRDAMASANAPNEFRKWEGVVESGRDGDRVMLNPAAAKRLAGRAREMLQPLGLLGREVASESVRLDQVAHLDAKGNELEHGAGRATVRFQYAVDGVPVRGAGAKTLLMAEPSGGDARFAGVFHAWRPIGGATPVKMSSVEEALGVGLLTDPELDRYSMAGHRIRVTRLELVYLALPAFMRQGHLFPAFQVEGVVSEGKLGISFHFGRFHHAVAPKAYEKAGLHAGYLATNPDGIKPLDKATMVK